MIIYYFKLQSIVFVYIKNNFNLITDDVHKTQPIDYQSDCRFPLANTDSEQHATTNLEESLASLHIDESLSEAEVCYLNCNLCFNPFPHIDAF